MPHRLGYVPLPGNEDGVAFKYTLGDTFVELWDWAMGSSILSTPRHY